jgi:hypothetical protein
MIVCSKRRCLILAGLLLGVVHCGPIGIPVERLARETRYCSDYRDYRKLNGEKAWAVAGDPCGVFVAGLTYEQADAATAESRALLLCEARRVDRKVEAPCVVHARRLRDRQRGAALLSLAPRRAERLSGSDRSRRGKLPWR